MNCEFNRRLNKYTVAITVTLSEFFNVQPFFFLNIRLKLEMLLKLQL